MIKLKPYLKKLENLLAELSQLKERQIDDILKSTIETYAMRFLVLQFLQLSINIATKIITFDSLGTPTSYEECFRLLLDKEYISEDSFELFNRFLHLRNQLINGFDGVDDKDVFIVALNSENFIKFIEEISVNTADR